jgi:hypothetical protein
VSDPGRGCQLPSGRQAAAGIEEHHAARSPAAGPDAALHEATRPQPESEADAILGRVTPVLERQDIPVSTRVVT